MNAVFPYDPLTSDVHATELGGGDIDWDDYDLFANCVGGPDDPPTGDCGPAADMGGGDVDIEDFAEFQWRFEG